MALHLGWHWAHFVGWAKKTATPTNTIALILQWLFRAIVLGICAYGLYNFIIRSLWEEMFLMTEFKMFDYDKSVFLYFVESLSIMIIFTSISYYLKKGILQLNKIKQKRRLENREKTNLGGY